MRTITWGSIGVARVWCDSLPPVTYPALKTIERRLETHRLLLSKARCAAVEVAGMVGHPSSYGLLGACFTPLATDQLLIEVVCSTECEHQIDWALAGRCDKVHVGLPTEYGPSVLHAAEIAGVLVDLDPGLLLFDHAAHGVVGSSDWFFGELGRIVVHLLTRDAIPMSDDELSDIVQFGPRR